MARKKRRPIPPPPNKGQIRAGAENKAKQNSAPKLAALRGEKKAARKDYRQQLGSVKGASAMLQDALDISRKELRAEGLRGPYLQSTLAELQSRKGDAAAAIPFEQAALKQELRNTLASITDQQQTEQISMEADADAIYKRRLQNKRDQRQKVIKNQRQRRQDRLEAADKDRRGFRNAKLNTQLVWSAMNDLAGKDTKGLTPEDKQQVEKAQSLVKAILDGNSSAVNTFIQNVAKRESTDPLQARRAVNKFIETQLSLLGRSKSFIRGR